MKFLGILLLGASVGASTIPQNQASQEIEIRALNQILKNKDLVCGDGKMVVSLGVRSPRPGQLTVKLEGDWGSGEYRMNTIAVGDKLVMSYGHDEGFGLFVVDINSWKNRKTVANLWTGWQLDLGTSDNQTLGAPKSLTCDLE
jgi:hypothetical protein